MTGRNGWAEYPQTEMHIDKRMFIPRHEIEDIIAEIAEDMANAEEESRKTHDDVDLGISIGLQMAFDTIKKRLESEG